MQNRAYTDSDMLEKMSILSLRTGDVLVVSTAQDISFEASERLKAVVKSAVGDVPILVLSDGIEIGIVRKDESQ